MTTTRLNAPLLMLLLTAALLSGGCELVEGIFKAGMWVGIIIVVLIAAVIIWIMGRLRR